jgi:hypothetical protein
MLVRQHLLLYPSTLGRRLGAVQTGAMQAAHFNMQSPMTQVCLPPVFNAYVNSTISTNIECRTFPSITTETGYPSTLNRKEINSLRKRLRLQDPPINVI